MARPSTKSSKRTEICHTPTEIKMLTSWNGSCKKRLINQGHEPIDVHVMQYSIAHTLREHNVLVYRLTSKGWPLESYMYCLTTLDPDRIRTAFKLVRSELEAHVTNQKATRLRCNPKLKPEGHVTDFGKAGRFIREAKARKDRV